MDCETVIYTVYVLLCQRCRTKSCLIGPCSYYASDITKVTKQWGIFFGQYVQWIIGGATGLSHSRPEAAQCFLIQYSWFYRFTFDSVNRDIENNYYWSSYRTSGKMSNKPTNKSDGSWTLKQLREELRLRKAKLDGRKSELVERWDRHYCFL